MSLFFKTALFAVIAISITSCATVGGKTEITADRVKTDGEPTKSNVVTDGEGNMNASYAGIAPGVTKQDASGTWTSQPGPHGVATFNPETKDVMLVSPNDSMIKADRIDYLDDGTSTTITLVNVTVENNITPNIEQQRLTFADAAATIQSIAPEQRLETIQQWESAGTVTTSIAQQLIAQFITGGV